VSDYNEALRLMSAAKTATQRDRAMGLFSTHTNLTAILGLLQDAVDKDDIKGIDERMEMLEILVQRHRLGHRPGQSAPRRQYEGTVEVGPLNYVDGVVRIETERFELWLYEGKGERQVRVEIEAR
jgi:hypothetical protein